MESIAQRGHALRVALRQLNLFDSNSVPIRRHNLFFAILPPPPDIARRISESANRLCTILRLRKKPFAPGRLHVSLQGLGARVEYPTHLARYAMLAASRIALPRFEARFDSAASFCGRSRAGRNFPLVLFSRDANDGFVELHRALGRGLRIQPHLTYTPHITLLYDEQVAAQAPIEPITWMIEEFVLIHSLMKEPHHPKQPYSIVGRWRLR